MRGVDQREGGLLAGLGRRVVAQVRRDEGVDAGGPYVGEEAVARAAADGDGADERVRVAGDADALRGGGQPGGDAGGEVAQGGRRVEFTDAAEAPAARGVGGVGDEGAGDPQVQRSREGVGDAGVGAVGVGVGDVQRNVVLDQGVHGAALEGGRRDRRRTAQIEGVVGDEEVRAELHGFVDGLLDRVDGEQDPAHPGVGIAADRTDRVPALGPLRGPEGVERGDDFRQTGHADRLPAPRAPPAMA